MPNGLEYVVVIVYKFVKHIHAQHQHTHTHTNHWSANAGRDFDVRHAYVRNHQNC